jgi:hypothetical protein
MRLAAWILLGTFLAWPPGALAAGVPTPIAVLSGTQWEAVLKEFEGSVQTLVQELDRIEADRKKLGEQIQVLEAKISVLRKKAETGANVLDEIRLKGLLNDLKEKLVRNSSLEHRWEVARGELEQKGLSLVALYHSRIEEGIRLGDEGSTGPAGEAKLGAMEELARKRTKVQAILAKYPPKEEAALPSLSALETLKKNDRESLQLTLDLLNDRKREITDQLEKWSLEEEEVRNELKLQARMQEFLEDLRRQNQGSGMTGGVPKRDGLEGMAEKSQRSRLGKRLGEIQTRMARAKETLEQIGRLTAKVQSQLEALKGGSR